MINGICYGCFVSIPTALASDVRRNDEVRHCDHCGRFIYVMSSRTPFVRACNDSSAGDPRVPGARSFTLRNGRYLATTILRTTLWLLTTSCM